MIIMYPVAEKSTEHTYDIDDGKTSRTVYAYKIRIINIVN